MNTDEFDEVSASREVVSIIGRTSPAKRHLLSLVIDPDGSVRVMSRAGLASWLRANDLEALAREAARRRIVRGQILVLSLRREPRFAVLTREGNTLVSKPMHAEPETVTDPEATENERVHRPGVPTGNKRVSP